MRIILNKESKMKITKHWNITREDDTEYTKFFLDNGKILELDVSTNKWTLKGKTGRAIKNDNSVFEAIKLVSPYFDLINGRIL